MGYHTEIICIHPTVSTGSIQYSVHVSTGASDATVHIAKDYWSNRQYRLLLYGPSIESPSCVRGGSDRYPVVLPRHADAQPHAQDASACWELGSCFDAALVVMMFLAAVVCASRVENSMCIAHISIRIPSIHPSVRNSFIKYDFRSLD